jgi:hypothetical protein
MEIMLVAMNTSTSTLTNHAVVVERVTRLETRSVGLDSADIYSL